MHEHQETTKYNDAFKYELIKGNFYKLERSWSVCAQGIRYVSDVVFKVNTCISKCCIEDL